MKNHSKLLALLVASAVLQGCVGVVNVHLYDEMSMRAELDKRAKQGVVPSASTEWQ